MERTAKTARDTEQDLRQRADTLQRDIINRKALQTELTDLEAQATATRDRIAVLMKLGVGGVLMREKLDNGFRTGAEVAAATTVRCIGTLPEHKTSNRQDRPIRPR